MQTGTGLAAQSRRLGQCALKAREAHLNLDLSPPDLAQRLDDIDIYFGILDDMCA